MSWIIFGFLLFANLLSRGIDIKRKTEWERDMLIRDCEDIKKQEAIHGRKIQNNYNCEELKEEDILRWKKKRDLINEKLKKHGYNGALE